MNKSKNWYYRLLWVFWNLNTACTSSVWVGISFYCLETDSLSTPRHIYTFRRFQTSTKPADWFRQYNKSATSERDKCCNSTFFIWNSAIQHSVTKWQIFFSQATISNHWKWTNGFLPFQHTVLLVIGWNNPNMVHILSCCWRKPQWEILEILHYPSM